MASQFKGSTVKVILSDGSSVVGMVTDVVNGQLSLSNVVFLNTGIRRETFELKGSSIVDLEMVQTTAPHTQGPPPAQPAQPAPAFHPDRTSTPHYYEPLQGSNKSTPTPAVVQSPQKTQPQLLDPAILSAAPMTTVPQPNLVPSTISKPTPTYPQTSNTHFTSQATETDDYDNNSSSESSTNANPYTADHVYKQSPSYYQAGGNTRRVKPSPIRPGSSNSSKFSQKERRSKGRSVRGRHAQYPSMESDGWATEDVTDFKDTEFDFQANLERFDKAVVFDEIRQNDSTLPSDRLVAFNKIQGPVVPGGRTMASNGQVKYGHKEMVLQNKSSEWELSDDDAANREYAFDEDDGDDDESYVSDILSAPPPPPPPPARRPSRPQLQADSVKLVAVNTKKTCLCASPVQMVELERLMTESFGITDAMLTENAGRGVARLALQSLGGSPRFSYGNHNSRPVVVVFVGNSRTGARALAAARHLANRQVRIIAVAVGCVEDAHRSGADEVLPEIKIQLKALDSCKGNIVTRFDQFMGELNMIDSPPELIIDALQGYQVTLDDLWDEDVATVKSCIEWANNRQKAAIVSLDIPSGLDSATGLPGSTSITPINAKWVLSCGLPLTGIKHAYLTGVVSPGDWTHYVVDVGFPRRSLHRGSLRRFGQIWFGAEWLLPLDVVID